MPNKIPTHRPIGSDTEQARQRLCNRNRKGGTTARGYDWTWRKQSKAWLAANPMCLHCAARGVRTVAKHCDHIDGDPLAYDPRLQSLCASCHSRKTALEDGGFGRAKK